VKPAPAEKPATEPATPAAPRLLADDDARVGRRWTRRFERHWSRSATPDEVRDAAEVADVAEPERDVPL
jgi:hypothetical protein